MTGKYRVRSPNVNKIEEVVCKLKVVVANKNGSEHSRNRSTGVLDQNKHPEYHTPVNSLGGTLLLTFTLKELQTHILTSNPLHVQI